MKSGTAAAANHTSPKHTVSSGGRGKRGSGHQGAASIDLTCAAAGVAGPSAIDAMGATNASGEADGGGILGTNLSPALKRSKRLKLSRQQDILDNAAAAGIGVDAQGATASAGGAAGDSAGKAGGKRLLAPAVMRAQACIGTTPSKFHSVSQQCKRKRRHPPSASNASRPVAERMNAAMHAARAAHMDKVRESSAQQKEAAVLRYEAAEGGQYAHESEVEQDPEDYISGLRNQDDVTTSPVSFQERLKGRFWGRHFRKEGETGVQAMVVVHARCPAGDGVRCMLGRTRSVQLSSLHAKKAARPSLHGRASGGASRSRQKVLKKETFDADTARLTKNDDDDVIFVKRTSQRRAAAAAAAALATGTPETEVDVVRPQTRRARGVGGVGGGVATAGAGRRQSVPAPKRSAAAAGRETASRRASVPGFHTREASDDDEVIDIDTVDICERPSHARKVWDGRVTLVSPGGVKTTQTNADQKKGKSRRMNLSSVINGGKEQNHAKAGKEGAGRAGGSRLCLRKEAPENVCDQGDGTMEMAACALLEVAAQCAQQQMGEYGVAGQSIGGRRRRASAHAAQGHVPELTKELRSSQKKQQKPTEASERKSGLRGPRGSAANSMAAKLAGEGGRESHSCDEQEVYGDNDEGGDGDESELEFAEQATVAEASKAMKKAARKRTPAASAAVAKVEGGEYTVVRCAKRNKRLRTYTGAGPSTGKVTPGMCRTLDEIQAAYPLPAGCKNFQQAMVVPRTKRINACAGGDQKSGRKKGGVMTWAFERQSVPERFVPEQFVDATFDTAGFPAWSSDTIPANPYNIPACAPQSNPQPRNQTDIVRNCLSQLQSASLRGPFDAEATAMIQSAISQFGFIGGTPGDEQHTEHAQHAPPTSHAADACGAAPPASAAVEEAFVATAYTAHNPEATAPPQSRPSANATVAAVTTSAAAAALHAAAAAQHAAAQMNMHASASGFAPEEVSLSVAPSPPPPPAAAGPVHASDTVAAASVHASDAAAAAAEPVHSFDAAVAAHLHKFDVAAAIEPVHPTGATALQLGGYSSDDDDDAMAPVDTLPHSDGEADAPPDASLQQQQKQQDPQQDQQDPQQAAQQSEQPKRRISLPSISQFCRGSNLASQTSPSQDNGG